MSEVDMGTIRRFAAFFFSAFFAQSAVAETMYVQSIDVMDGQGISGQTNISLVISDSGDWFIDIDSIHLQYEPNAQFNNIDDQYSGMPMVGFQSVLRPPQRDAQSIDVQLVPVDGSFDTMGRFSCTNCGSFVLGRADLDRSEIWTSGLVAGNIIFFNSLQVKVPSFR